jgi:hypothetical protein
VLKIPSPLLLLFFLFLPLSALPAGGSPWEVGERLEYELRYKMFRIGRSTLEVRSRRTYRGQEVLELVNEVRSASWVDRIFPIRDTVRSYMDPEHGWSLHYEKHIREGRYRRDIEADLYHDRSIAEYSKGDVELVPGSHDILTAIFAARRGDLEPGDSFSIPVHDDKKNYPLTVKVIRRDTMNTVLGERECLLLEPHLESGGLFNKSGRLLVWVSADSLAIPVKMQSQVPIGSFVSELKSYRKGR